MCQWQFLHKTCSVDIRIQPAQFVSNCLSICLRACVLLLLISLKVFSIKKIENLQVNQQKFKRITSSLNILYDLLVLLKLIFTRQKIIFRVNRELPRPIVTFEQNSGQNACQQRNFISSSRVRKLSVLTN